MLRRKSLRRGIGIALVVAGAILMWLAPEATFGVRSGAGLVLLTAGIVLELLGIALERWGDSRKR